MNIFNFGISLVDDLQFTSTKLIFIYPKLTKPTYKEFSVCLKKQKVYTDVIPVENTTHTHISIYIIFGIIVIFVLFIKKKKQEKRDKFIMYNLLWFDMTNKKVRKLVSLSCNLLLLREMVGKERRWIHSHNEIMILGTILLIEIKDVLPV